jgi:hypothetical protein
LTKTSVNNHHYSLRNNPVLIHFVAEARNKASGNPPTCSGIIALFLVEYGPGDVRRKAECNSIVTCVYIIVPNFSAVAVLHMVTVSSVGTQKLEVLK